MSPFSGIVYLGVILLIMVFLLRGFLRVKQRAPAPIETKLSFPEKERVWGVQVLAKALNLFEMQMLWQRSVSIKQIQLFLEYQTSVAPQVDALKGDTEWIASYLQKESEPELILWLFYSGKIVKNFSSEADADYWLNKAVECKQPYALLIHTHACLLKALQKNNWDDEIKIFELVNQVKEVGLNEIAYLVTVFDICKRKPSGKLNEWLLQLKKAEKAGLKLATYLQARIELNSPSKRPAALEALFGLAEQDYVEAKLFLVLDSKNLLVNKQHKQSVQDYKENLIQDINLFVIEYECSQENFGLENSIRFEVLCAAAQAGSIKVLPTLLKGLQQPEIALTVGIKEGFNLVFNSAYTKNVQYDLARMLFYLAFYFYKSGNKKIANYLELLLVNLIDKNEVATTLDAAMLESVNESEEILGQAYLMVLQLSIDRFHLGHLSAIQIEQLCELNKVTAGLSAIQLYLVGSLHSLDLKPLLVSDSGLLCYEYAMFFQYQGDAKQAWSWMQAARILKNETARIHIGHLLLGEFSFDSADSMYRDWVTLDPVLGAEYLLGAVRQGSVVVMNTLIRYYLSNSDALSYKKINQLMQSISSNNREEHSLANIVCQTVCH